MQYRIFDHAPATHFASKVLREYDIYDEAYKFAEEFAEECGYGIKETGTKVKTINCVKTTTVVNMPRYGCYSQVRIAIQLGRYQKDLGSV
jgi:hypothetical protein